MSTRRSTTKKPASPRRKLVLMNPGAGRPGARLGQVPRPTQPVDDFSIALWAFAELERYEQARKQDAWTPSVLAFDIQANGVVLRRIRVQGPGYTDYKKVGNLLTWKFSPQAFLLVPRAAEAATPIERRRRI